MGHQNQQRISSNNNATGSAVNAIQSINRFRGANARGNQSGRTVVNRASVGQCHCCGQSWAPTHRQVCPAMVKKCNYCGLLNHFAKVCRRKLNTARNTEQKNRINNIETAEISDQNSSQEIPNVNYINYNEQINSDYDSSDDNYVAAVENVNSPQAALKNVMITIGNTNCDLLLDSGSGCTIINLSLAKEIMYNCPQSQWSEKKTIRIKVFFEWHCQNSRHFENASSVQWLENSESKNHGRSWWFPTNSRTRPFWSNRHNNIAETWPECRSQ